MNFCAASIQGGGVTFSATSITALTYSPPADFTGLDTFTFAIIDGQGGVTCTVMANVGGSSPAPGSPGLCTLLPGGKVALLFSGTSGK